MSPQVKAFLTKVAKQATNAALMAIGPIAVWHYSIHSWKDMQHVLVIFGSAIASRELTLVIIPLLAKGYAWLAEWSSSNGNGA